MKQLTKQHIVHMLSILFSAVTLLAAVLLIFHCLSIYFVGTSSEVMDKDNGLQTIFSREIVILHLKEMSWAFYLWLAIFAAQLATRWAIPDALVEPAPLPNRIKPIDAPQKHWYAPLRLVLYAVAILLIVVGILNGGMWDVLVKAIHICTECIGLG